MLAAGEIDFVYVTHEHVDHYWGLAAATRYRPDVNILVPTGFSAKSKELARRAAKRASSSPSPASRFSRAFISM